MKETNEFKARKALHKYFGSDYVDHEVTSKQVSELWPFLRGIGPCPNRLAKLANEGPMSKELLQEIYDKLNIYDIA